MILSGEEIHRRLKAGDIFVCGTWDENCLKEASYALRIANDGLLIDGIFYDPGIPYTQTYINIEPGQIAILSTVERLKMPPDLVGKVGVRFNPAIRGLTGLMGIQVDPLYGQNQEDERLFVRVANLGNDTVRFLPGAIVFTFELHEVAGNVQPPAPEKVSTWNRIKKELANQNNSSWSYATRVQSNVDEQGKSLKSELSSETQNLREHLQPVVMFGIFLVAVTILGVSLTVILSVRDIPAVDVPNWVTSWGWILLLTTLSVATIATAVMGVAMAIWTVRRSWKGGQRLKKGESN